MCDLTSPESGARNACSRFGIPTGGVCAEETGTIPTLRLTRAIAESGGDALGSAAGDVCVNQPAAVDGQGSGAPVVLLHGQPGAGSDWGDVVRALPPHLRSFALDRPGYRASPYPPGSLRDNAEWLLSELDRAEVHDAVLVGHSYGGGVALSTALLAPGRVRGLVLIASVGPGCLDGWDTLLAAPVAGPICALAAWWLTPWVARKRLAHLERIRGRPLELDEHLNWEAWGNARHEHGAMWRTFLTEQRELVGAIDELVAQLGQIAAPTVVIADPSDRMIPVATSHALSELIPHARLVLVGDGGHHLPRRVPQVVAAEIARLAESLDGSGP